MPKRLLFIMFFWLEKIFYYIMSMTNLKVIGDRFGEEIGDLERQTWK